METLGFKSILDLIKAFPNEQTCIEHLESLRWNGNVISPFDESSIVYKCKNNRYRCKNTGKYFNVKTGTIFDNTKIPLQKWFMALYVFSSHKKGISSHQLGRDISVTQKTAWFLLHRLRYAFEHPAFKKALGLTNSNEVEADETYIGGHEKNKHSNKKTEGSEGGNNKAAVFGIIERKGNVIAKHIDNTRHSTIQNIIYKNVIKMATINTDEAKCYKELNNHFFHYTVNHSAKEYVNGLAHVNSIECFWSHLKRGIDGIYHWVSTEHLQSYINEFSLRYNTRKSETSDRFNLILGNVIIGHLTYQNLISHE